MPSRTVSVPPERLDGWLHRFADRHGPLAVTAADPLRILARAPDGAGAEFEVPFPPLEASDDPLRSLVEHAARERLVGVVLVRRGGYAVGVCDGRRLVSSKVGSGYVQGKTKAGGWSQQRFARRRSNQAEALWGAAAEVAVRLLLPHVGALAAVVTGGDRAGAGHVLADPRLKVLLPLVQPRMLSVPDPKLAVLATTPDLFRAVRIGLDDRA